MSTEIATRDPSTLAVRYELEVEDLIAQVGKIQALVAKIMKDGEHYGVIPSTGTKPTLLKPGAEKLCLLFRLDPQYHSAETYDGKHLTVKTTCTLWHIPTGQRWGSGEGSCSTKESKYAYRHGKRVCPKCGAESINRSKYPPRGKSGAEPGWYCHKKANGCGAEFEANDTAITGQITGRIANEDVADQYNTVLKMSNKRALVAAVLNVTAASDIFTQDIEDTHSATSTAGDVLDITSEPEPDMTEQEDRRLLLAKIAEYGTVLGLPPAERTDLWNTHIGRGVKSGVASFDKLLALEAHLAGLVKERFPVTTEESA